MSVRVIGRQAVLLVRPLARAVPWVPVAAAIGLSVVAVLPALSGASAPAAQIWALRIAAVLLGAGASFAMVDLMAPLTMTPAPRWLRQWLRLALAVIPVTAVWLPLYLVAVATLPNDPASLAAMLPDGNAAGAAMLPAGNAVGAPGMVLPFKDLMVEAAVCGLAGMAGAAIAARIGHTTTAALAGPATQGALLLATLFLTGHRSPWPLPSAPAWADVHTYWLWALPLCVAALLVANRETWPLLSRRRRAAGSA